MRQDATKTIRRWREESEESFGQVDDPNQEFETVATPDIPWPHVEPFYTPESMNRWMADNPKARLHGMIYCDGWYIATFSSKEHFDDTRADLGKPPVRYA